MTNWVIYLIASFTIACAGCSATIKTPKRVNIQMLSQDKRHLLDGNYSNHSSEHDLSLGGLLNYFPSDSIWRNRDVTIKIKIIGKNRLSIKALLADSAMAETILKGRFRQGYFRVKTETTGICIPFVYCFRDSYKAQIGLTNGNVLIVDFAESWFGSIFIINAGDNMQRTFNFTKQIQ